MLKEILTQYIYIFLPNVLGNLQLDLYVFLFLLWRRLSLRVGKKVVAHCKQTLILLDIQKKGSFKKS